MPSAYLTIADAPLYGVANASTSQITAASTLIDAYLKRPEGLIWAADSFGLPAYMQALQPTYSLTLAAPIAPGSNVPVTFTNIGLAGTLQPGDVIILDRPGSAGATTAVTEACVISSSTNPSSVEGVAPTIQLQTVINAHAEGAPADYGCVIEEQKYMPKDRPITMLSRTPLMRPLSGVGRYGYGRRGEGANYNMEQFNLLAAVSKFGGPPVWELFQPSIVNNWDVQTGQLWVPAGVMLAYYSEVKVRYVAGFTYANLPSVIKAACANLIQTMASMPASGSVKTYKAGDTSMTMFAASVLNDDIKAQIQSYAAREFY